MTACVVVATTGTLLTIGPVGGGEWTRSALGLGSVLSYAVYILLSSRIVTGVGPFATAGVVMAGAAVVYDVGAVATQAPWSSVSGCPSSSSWAQPWSFPRWCVWPGRAPHRLRRARPHRSEAAGFSPYP